MNRGRVERGLPVDRSACPCNRDTLADIAFVKRSMLVNPFEKFERDKEGDWIDEIPDGNDHSIDVVRYAMLDDVLRG